jgi:cytoskeletal protein CcmA (bactofilin family)
MTALIRANEPNIGKSGYPPDTGYARPVRSNKAKVVASSWHVEDQATSAGGLVIDGQLECAAAHHKEHLTVAKHAQVRADVHAKTVLIYGQLIGDIYSDGMVTLARGSKVKGNIYCAALYIDEGATFLGKVKMDEVSDDVAKNRANWPLSG